jgi:hypothetical protein
MEKIQLEKLKILCTVAGSRVSRDRSMGLVTYQPCGKGRFDNRTRPRFIFFPVGIAPIIYAQPEYLIALFLRT